MEGTQEVRNYRKEAMTIIDILPFFLLAMLAAAACGYCLGQRHGVIAGEEMGRAKECSANKGKIIQAKREGYAAAVLQMRARKPDVTLIDSHDLANGLLKARV